MKTFALLLCLALVAPSCSADKVLIITGDSLVSLADQFSATAAAMDKAVDAKAITPESYRAWKTFGLKFQESYPLARHLWQVAADHKDAQLQAQATAMVTQMAVDLGAYAALVGVKP